MQVFTYGLRPGQESLAKDSPLRLVRAWQPERAASSLRLTEFARGFFSDRALPPNRVPHGVRHASRLDRWSQIKACCRGRLNQPFYDIHENGAGTGGRHE